MTAPKPKPSHLQQALDILDRMDDAITERGGDEDEFGRRELAPIRRAKDHLRKAIEETAAVTIIADDDAVTVTVVRNGQRELLAFETPGMLTGADLQEVLTACGVRTRYTYLPAKGESR